MMHRQLLAVVALCLAIGAAAFRLGWWASDQLSSYAQEIDPRIERKYTKNDSYTHQHRVRQADLHRPRWQ